MRSNSKIVFLSRSDVFYWMWLCVKVDCFHIKSSINSVYVGCWKNPTKRWKLARASCLLIKFFIPEPHSIYFVDYMRKMSLLNLFQINTEPKKSKAYILQVVGEWKQKLNIQLLSISFFNFNFFYPHTSWVQFHHRFMSSFCASRFTPNLLAYVAERTAGVHNSNLMAGQNKNFANIFDIIRAKLICFTLSRVHMSQKTS